MNKELDKLCNDLQDKLRAVYEEGITLDEAEKRAAEFLNAQFAISSEIARMDLDCRMRKSGVKAIRAAIYLEEVQKADKKPSDTLLEQIVNSNEIVQGEQERLDTAEVELGHIQRVFSILKDGHIFTRGMAKNGGYNG